jgi:hypothetical protein
MFLLGIVYISILLYCLNQFVSYHFGSKYKVVVIKHKLIKLGTLPVRETTLLEWKPLFSLKLFYFYPGEAQEIYHTHSFSSYSFLIFGNYVEAFYSEEKGYWSENRNRSRLIYIPENRFHQITQSKGCMTLMLTGPWKDSYQEFNPSTNEIIISTHGRREIKRYVK